AAVRAVARARRRAAVGGTLAVLFFVSSRRRHTRWPRDWSSDVCSSDLGSTCPGRRCSAATPTRPDREHAAGAGMGRVGVAAEHRSEERRVGKQWRAPCAADERQEYVTCLAADTIPADAADEHAVAVVEC